MVKLKDVAELAGVSVAAVSLYINGKAKGRVSPETQRMIEQAIAETGYTRPTPKTDLRSASATQFTKTVLIFWSIDFKRALLGDLIGGMQTAITELSSDENIDFIIRPYALNELYKHKRTLCSNQYHAALIVSATVMDMQFLQSISPQMPIVLLNRNMNGFHGVYIDSDKIGKQAAELIRQKGYTRICTVNCMSQYMAMNSRFLAFINACKDQGIHIPNEFQIITEDSISSGEGAAEEYLSINNRPSIIFAATDSLAFGILKRLQSRGVSVPEECAVFSFGYERFELSKYASPPISTIDISTYALAYNGMQLIIDILNRGITVPQHIELSGKIHLRNSF